MASITGVGSKNYPLVIEDPSNSSTPVSSLASGASSEISKVVRAALSVENTSSNDNKVEEFKDSSLPAMHSNYNDEVLDFFPNAEFDIEKLVLEYLQSQPNPDPVKDSNPEELNIEQWVAECLQSGSASVCQPPSVPSQSSTIPSVNLNLSAPSYGSSAHKRKLESQISNNSTIHNPSTSVKRGRYRWVKTGNGESMYYILFWKERTFFEYVDGLVNSQEFEDVCITDKKKWKIIKKKIAEHEGCDRKLLAKSSSMKSSYMRVKDAHSCDLYTNVNWRC